MKYFVALTVITLPLVASADGPARSFEELIRANTVWERVSSNDVEGNACPELLHLGDLSTPGSNITSQAENEDWRPGDMSLYFHRVQNYQTPSQRFSAFGIHLPFRPNSPAGKTILRDSGVPGGLAYSEASVENLPDRIILTQGFEYNPETFIPTLQITFLKNSGSLEIMSKVGLSIQKCRFDVAEGALQPESVVDSDRAVPREDTGRGEASRAPAVEAADR